MVWYPSADDLIDINIMCLDLMREKHPHKLLGTRRAIQSLIDAMVREESKGLMFQAAFLLKKMVYLHFFDGANHRTAYVAAKMFLRRNDKRFRVDQWEIAYPFISALEVRSIEETQRWIESGTSEESQ
jgi:death-on-curing family protein